MLYVSLKNFYSSNYPEDMIHYKVMRYEIYAKEEQSQGTIKLFKNSSFCSGEDRH